MKFRVCFLGGMRYSKPLDATQEKKWRLLSEVGEMRVIGFSQDWRPRRFTQHAQFYLLPKLPVPVLRYLLLFTLGPVLALWCILRYGVRILTAQSPHEGFAAALAKRTAHLLGRRVALIVETHGDFETALFLQRRIVFPGLYRFLMSEAARFALKHADLLRAISNTTRKQIEKWEPDKQVLQFPTWTDLDVFLEMGMMNGTKNPPEIVYAGVLTPLKGVHHLVNAFRNISERFPEATLVLIGGGENADYAAEIRTQVRQLGLDGHAEFAGSLPQTDLASRMGRASVFVLPSLSEGLGRVIFEAMAAGTPVIASRVDGIPEIVQDGKTGFLVPPGDVEALADRIRWVLEHPEEARRMGESARAFARRFFSTGAYVQSYARLFHEAQLKIQSRE